jgi:molybdenum cofactor sulfurtransferase
MQAVPPERMAASHNFLYRVGLMGVGCLLARREALAKLRRPWFAGGTIWVASVLADWHKLAENEEAFEDGTLDYLSLPAIEIGLRYIQSIGIELMHERVRCLTGWLLEQLLSLRHSNGVPLVRVHGPQTCAARGGTIAFNVLDPDGRIIDERVVDLRAAEHNLSIRTGCFCNPGAGEAAYSIDKQTLTATFASDSESGQHMTYSEYVDVIGLRSAGAHRISLGIVSNFADVYHFIEFLRTFIDFFPDNSELPPRLHC